MPKKQLPAWAKVGARVLIRSSAYGARIPATAQRGVVVEITSAGLLYVRTLVDQKRWAERGRTDSPRIWAARFEISDDESGAFEFERIIGRQRRSLLPDTPANRERWRDEMRAFSARMVEQRRSERKRKLAQQEVEALRARRLAALDKLAKLWRADQSDRDESVDELLAFMRGVIGRGDNEA